MKPPPLIPAAGQRPPGASEFAAVTAPPDNRPPPVDDDRRHEIQAEERRERAFAAQGTREWGGVPLAPWSIDRQALFARLVSLDLPGASLDELPLLRDRYDTAVRKLEPGSVPPFEEVANLDLYIAPAAKVLWLSLHAPGEIDALRSRPMLFIRAIEEWSADNIRPDEIPAAVSLAAEISEEWRMFRAVVRPSRSGGDHSGN
jgi:hypothetical protein